MSLGIIAGLLVITAFVAREWETIKHRERMRRRYRRSFKHLKGR
jgi:hypothetical protein